MDQVKIDQVISNFLKAVFHNLDLVHSWMLCLSSIIEVYNYFFRDLSETFTVFTTTPVDGLSFKAIVLQLY